MVSGGTGDEVSRLTEATELRPKPSNDGNSVARSAIYGAHPAQESGLRGVSNSDSVPGNWRQHGNFQRHQLRPAAPARLSRSGPPGGRAAPGNLPRLTCRLP